MEQEHKKCWFWQTDFVIITFEKLHDETQLHSLWGYYNTHFCTYCRSLAWKDQPVKVKHDCESQNYLVSEPCQLSGILNIKFLVFRVLDDGQILETQ
jgi:hypothetical protein